MGIERYAGRVALVTGASSGIGAAITQALLREGLTVVGLARRVDRVKALELQHVPGELHALQGDVSEEASILQAFKWIKDNLGGVDILINNAGIVLDGDPSSGSTEVWRRTLDVNVLGLSICTREAVQGMLQRGIDDGFIIHLSSLAAHIPPFHSALAMYSATKYAVKVLAEGLRKDLVANKSNIRVGQISPGFVRTEILDNSKAVTLEVFDAEPCLEPEDIANAVIYMLSQHPRVQVHDIIIVPTGSS